MLILNYRQSTKLIRKGGWSAFFSKYFQDDRVNNGRSNKVPTPVIWENEIITFVLFLEWIDNILALSWAQLLSWGHNSSTGDDSVHPEILQNFLQNPKYFPKIL